MAKPIISIKNFSKNFGRNQVIEDLSFEVFPGEIFAFLGPNGSGKTTTIRTLLGIYQPDAGELLINGEKYNSDMAAMLGYLPEERGLYNNAKVLETMVYFGQLKGLGYFAAQKKALNYLKKVDLLEKQNEQIKKLSSGQQQKIQLGVTIINNPRLLILDEPTKGLDPVNRDLLLDILLDLEKHGSTIIFSTHQMEEAETIADRLIMIKDGRKKLYGKIAEVKEQFGSNHIKLSFEGSLRKNPQLFTANIKTNYAELTPLKGVSTEKILKYLLDSHLQILKFEVSTLSLNEIFIKVAR